METYFETALKWIGCALFLVVIAMYVFGIGESEAETAAEVIRNIPVL